MSHPAWRAGVLDLLLACLLGTGVATGTVLWLQHDAEAGAEGRAIRSDRLDVALQALRDDGVYVAPDGRTLVDADGERAIEQAVAANALPVYVVVWATDHEIGLDRLLVEDLLQRELGDEDGFLFLWEGAQEGAVLDLGPHGGFLDGYSSASDFVGDPASTLVDAVSSVTPDAFYEDGGGDDYWGGLDGGATLGVLLGSTIVGTVLLLCRLAALVCGRRRLLPGDWRLWGSRT